MPRSSSSDDAKPYGPFEENAASKRYHCETCDVKVTGTDSWLQHLESTTHKKRSQNNRESSDDEFNLNEDDIYVDDDAPLLRHLNNLNYPFIGMECIIDDQTAGKIKCIVCRMILKDRHAITEHLKSHKHQRIYIDNNYPKLYEALLARRDPPDVFREYIMKYSKELVEEHGRQMCRVYEKGYGKKNSARKQTENANRSYQSESRRRSRSRSNTRSRSRSRSRHRRDDNGRSRSRSRGRFGGKRRSRSRSRSRYRSRSRSNSDDRKSDRSGSQSRSKKEHYSTRRRSPSTLTQQDSKNVVKGQKFLNKLHVFRRQYRRRSSSPEDNNSDVEAPSSSADRQRSTRRSRSRSQESSKAQPELRTPAVREPVPEEKPMRHMLDDMEIFHVLLSLVMAKFERGQIAFVQNELNRIREPLVGVKYIVEYADAECVYMPGYMCLLCERVFKSDEIKYHLLTDQHRLSVMKRDYKDLYDALVGQVLPLDMKRDLTRHFTKQIEEKEGRSHIANQIIVASSKRYVFSHHRKFGHMEPPQPMYVIEPPRPLAAPAEKVEVVDRYSLPPPPRSLPMMARIAVPKRPDFIYSEKTELAKKFADIEKLLPPFVERNIESGWYSIRKYTVDYYYRLVPPETSYISLRRPQALQEMYGNWSPYLMRRLQDQFNFTPDNLSWLQKLLVQFRVPLSKPLEDYELKSLNDEVEASVLKALIGEVMQPENFMDAVHARRIYEYDDKSTGDWKSMKPVAFETIVYDDDDDEKKMNAEEEGRKEKISKPTQETEIAQPPKSTAQTALLLTPTPSDEDQRSTNSKKSAGNVAAERAILALIDQILQTARTDTTKNPIMALLLRFDNARSILYELATKQPAVLQQLVSVMKNPQLNVDAGTLGLLEKKLTDISRECMINKIL